MLQKSVHVIHRAPQYRILIILLREWYLKIISLNIMRKNQRKN